MCQQIANCTETRKHSHIAVLTEKGIRNIKHMVEHLSDDTLTGLLGAPEIADRLTDTGQGETTVRVVLQNEIERRRNARNT